MKEHHVARGRWNAGDTLLIILACLSVTGIFLRLFYGQIPTGGEVHEYEIEAKWESVDARTLACLEEGELLYTPAGELFGVVTSISSRASDITITEGGILYRASSASEFRRDVILTVRVTGRFSDGVFFRDGKKPLGPGESYLLYSERAQLTLRVFRMPTEV